EVGLLDLPGGDAFNRLKGFFLGEATTIDCLDLIDLTFRTIDGDVRACWSHALQHEGAHFGEDNNGPYRDTSVPNGLAITQEPNDAIEELNRRFQQHGIGYRYGSHQLFRVDSQYAHHEIVRPALTLLQDVAFSGASEEFLRAHEHYRQGRNKEAIVEAEKAFESTLKTICDRLEWPYDPRSGAQALIKVIIDQHLVDGILQSFLSGLRAMLESGLPPIRNNIAAHGQGSRPMDVPDHLAAFALHSAATSILMLIHAYQLRMPRTSQPDVMNEP
ncbi:MAG TPA: hypothetical protein VLJ14_04135, partial [Ktedonobacterales bacterium]|nr:hypothetical protein [Ktedonobacterales bacterium]